MTDYQVQHHGSTPNVDSAPNYSTSGKQHSLSCTHCRQRKIKCDKVSPCAPCSRSGLACTFPERARHPRKKGTNSKAANDELMQRLARMEDLIEKMKDEGKDGSTGNNAETQGSVSPRMPQTRPQIRRESTQTSDTSRSKRDQSEEGLQNDSTLTLGGAFFKSIMSEVEGLKGIMDDVSDEEELTPESSQTPSDTRTTHNALFGSSPILPTKLRLLHPSPQHMSILGSFYARNFDPMFKALHIPSLEKLIMNASANVQDIPYGNYVEALLFAVYYCSATTLTQEECLQYLHEDRQVLLVRYRVGTETALANADMLNTTELGTLQALVIFLASVRSNDESQYVWTMTSVAIRLGHSFGLHREGSKPGLSPFQTEQRRRLWWQIIHLDLRCSEDRASDPFILPQSFNTKQPLNINDSDMDPQSIEPLIERKEFSEMSKSRGTYIVWKDAMRIMWDSIGFTWPLKEGEMDRTPTLTFEEKAAVVNQIEKNLENEVVIHCDPKIPLQWLTMMVSRLVISRCRLAIYHPPMIGGRSSFHPKVSRETVLKTAVQNLEYSYLIDREPAVANFRWWFNTHLQWHALAATLAELCVQSQGPLVEKAWTIVDAVFKEWATRIADSESGTLWRPIKKLMNKAQATRNASKVQTPSPPPQQQLPLPQFQPFSPLQDPVLANTPYHPNSVLSYAHSINMDQGLSSDILSSLDVNDTGESINWAEWEAFMQDFEMADAGTMDANAAQPDASQNWW